MTNVGKQPALDLPRARLRRPLVALIVLFLGTGCGQASEAAPAEDETLVVQLVHPDRQAAAVLKLFEGSRVPHPAAALAAWKKAARQPDQLGKPLEALIAFFNPEMAHEWHVMQGAKVCVNWDGADGRPRWHAIVPHDDGTVAAVVAALRLTDGASEPSLTLAGNEIAVQRLGRPGAIVAAQAYDAVIFGSTRDDLLRAAGRLGRALPHRSGDSVRAAGREQREDALLAGSGTSPDPGAIFVIDPSRLATGHSGPRSARMTGELLRALSCRRLHGRLALKEGCLGLDVTTHFPGEHQAPSALWNGTASIDPAWLEWVPSAGAMAVVSLAFEPSRSYWDSAFALADHVEKTDPARAELAPLRTRLNLLATAAGARLEADLWPHLRGLTAGVLGAPSRPGRPTGGLIALHLDSDAAAERLVSQTLPRLAKMLFPTTKDKSKTPPGQATEAARAATPGRAPKAPPTPTQNEKSGATTSPEIARRVATLFGRDATLWRHGRDVLITWGEGVLSAAQAAAARPALSVAPLCTGWLQTGKPAPERLGVLWPARCWTPPNIDALATTAAWSALAEDPPALWWGWNQQNQASDSIRWPGLKQRTHRFLDQIPLDPPTPR